MPVALPSQPYVVGGYGGYSQYGANYNIMQTIQIKEDQVKAKDEALKKRQAQVDLETKQLAVAKAQQDVEHQMVTMGLLVLPKTGPGSEEGHKLKQYAAQKNHDLKAARIKSGLDVDKAEMAALEAECLLAKYDAGMFESIEWDKEKGTPKGVPPKEDKGDKDAGKKDDKGK